MPTPETPDPSAFWDEKYAGAAYRYGTNPNAFLTEQAALVAAGSHVMAVGDGEGRNGVWLAEQGHRVVSVDASPRALQKAAKLALDRGVGLTTICADLTAWSWPKAHYDASVAIFLHVPSRQRPALHRAMLESVLPGGLVILEAFARGQLAWGTGGPIDPDLLYDAASLRADFEGAKILVLRERLTRLAEGRAHDGPAVVVSLVARRRG